MPLSPLYREFTSSDPELAAVDASVRWPVVASLLAAVHWMVTGTVLAVYASSLKHPADQMPILDVFNWLSEHCAVFTFGRVYPAAIDSLVYGWIGSAALGLIMWVLARMGRAPVRSPAALMTAVVFWNLGVAAGLIGIFMGQSTSVELLEFPGYAATILWCAFALFAYWSILNYLQRPAGHDQIGQWWILVGLLAFVWLFGGGSIMLNHPLPGSGVIQGMIAAWYLHGHLHALPRAHRPRHSLLPDPEMRGSPLRYSAYSRFAFWTWIVVAPWTAVHDLVGGPFPEATVSVGLIFSGLIFLPHGADRHEPHLHFALMGENKHHESVVLPFLNVAAMFFVAAGVCEQMLSVRTLNVMLHFTMFREANLFCWIYGFFSFVIFGACYYILPRLLNFGWRSTFLIKAHYYAAVYGILLVVGILAFGGIEQGSTLENADPQVTHHHGQPGRSLSSRSAPRSASASSRSATASSPITWAGCSSNISVAARAASASTTGRLRPRSMKPRSIPPGWKRRTHDHARPFPGILPRLSRHLRLHLARARRAALDGARPSPAHAPKPAATTSCPGTASGLAHAGEKVYAANGCVYCHTQQVRPAQSGADLVRGWGTAKNESGDKPAEITRRTYPRDYLWQGQVFLGNNRSGADLSNVAHRFPNAAVLYRYLYDPDVIDPHSSMPAYKFLFTTQRVTGAVSNEALLLTGATTAPGPATKLCPPRRPKRLSPTCSRSRKATTCSTNVPAQSTCPPRRPRHDRRYAPPQRERDGRSAQEDARRLPRARFHHPP